MAEYSLCRKSNFWLPWTSQFLNYFTLSLKFAFQKDSRDKVQEWPERIFSSQRYRQVFPRMALFLLCLVFTSFKRWTEVWRVVKGFLEPPFWFWKGYVCKPRTLLFSFPKRIVWLPQQGLTHLFIHVGKLRLSSCSLREKASLEGPEATTSLPQKRGKCNRKDREDWGICPVIRWPSPQKRVERIDPHPFGQ